MSEPTIDEIRTWWQVFAATHAWQEENKEYVLAIRALIDDVERWKKIIKIKDKLLTAYRLGDSKMADKALNELEGIGDLRKEAADD